MNSAFPDIVFVPENRADKYPPIRVFKGQRCRWCEVVIRDGDYIVPATTVGHRWRQGVVHAHCVVMETIPPPAS